MKSYDIIIIGGGVTGNAIARELSRYRLRIALLEREEELAFGVSKSNSGIIHPGTQTPAHSLKGKLCIQGNRLMRIVAKELGVDFKEVGELIVAFNDEEVSRLHQIKTEAEKLGVPKLEIVGPAWLRENEPNLNTDAMAALYAPTAGIISPYRLVYDLSENAKLNGVEIFTQSKVERINILKNSSNLNEERFEILTQASSYRTRFCINAAGLFADDISRMVGVDDFSITPRKGEEFLLDKKKEHMTQHLLFPLPSKKSKGILVIKTSDGNPMIGPTAQDITDKEDLSTSDQGLKEVLKGVQRMIPTISANDIIAYFAGLRPVGGDDFIIRHENKIPGFINVAGIQSPGLTAAPAIALMVVDILKANGLKFRLNFSCKRYRDRTKHLFAISLKETKTLIKKDKTYGDIACRCEMVSSKEIAQAIERGATTLDGIKFRTRAQAGRCHGGFCTTRIMKILAEKLNKPLTQVTKRGKNTEIVKGKR